MKAEVPLVRAVGLGSLTAVVVNGTIGAGIFVLPAAVARLVGPAGPYAYLLAGFAVFLVVLCFAEAAGRFDRSGGPFLYAGAAFGDLTGFLAGWMFLLSRVAGVAAVSNGFAAYAGFFWPAAASGAPRFWTLTALFALLTVVSLIGIRQGVWVMNLLTAAKLLPLAAFVALGFSTIDSRLFAGPAGLGGADLRGAALMLLFAFSGFEYATVPGDELINPRRNLPIALISGISIVSVCYLMVHIVAQGNAPNLGADDTPVATAAKAFLGPAGAALITLGALLSMAGNCSSSLLAASRMLYALAKDGPLPDVIARVHARFRTPWVAVSVFSLLSWAMAVSGTFAYLAVMASIGRLFFFSVTCAAVLVLRRKAPDPGQHFTVPGGPLIPLAAIALCIWLLTGVPSSQVKAGLAALVTGALLYAASLSGPRLSPYRRASSRRREEDG